MFLSIQDLFCCLNKLIFCFSRPLWSFIADLWSLSRSFSHLFSQEFNLSYMCKCVCVCVSPLLPLGPWVWTTWSWRPHAHYRPINTSLPPWWITARMPAVKNMFCSCGLLSRSYMLFMSAPSAVTARLLRVCVVIRQQRRQMELTGQLWHHDLGLWMDVWPPYDHDTDRFLFIRRSQVETEHTHLLHTQSLTATNQNSIHTSFINERLCHI